MDLGYVSGRKRSSQKFLSLHVIYQMVQFNFLCKILMISLKTLFIRISLQQGIRYKPSQRQCDEIKNVFETKTKVRLWGKCKSCSRRSDPRSRARSLGRRLRTCWSDLKIFLFFVCTTLTLSSCIAYFCITRDTQAKHLKKKGQFCLQINKSS